MRILFIAPTSNLRTSDEILRSMQGQTVSICDGDVDRAKAERFLKEEQDYIHFAGHGDPSILEWSDGAITVDELLGMLAYQKHLRGVVITACNSARVGAEIHNALHVPVVMCQAEISDPAALRFSEAFYRALRAAQSIHQAVEVSRAALAKMHPTDADVVTLINGDMATDAELSECMSFVRQELGELRAKLESLEAAMKRIETQQPRTWVAVLVLLG